jgi:hypothetical protein
MRAPFALIRRTGPHASYVLLEWVNDEFSEGKLQGKRRVSSGSPREHENVIGVRLQKDPQPQRACVFLIKNVGERRNRVAVETQIDRRTYQVQSLRALPVDVRKSSAFPSRENIMATTPPISV